MSTAINAIKYAIRKESARLIRGVRTPPRGQDGRNFMTRTRKVYIFQHQHKRDDRRKAPELMFGAGEAYLKKMAEEDEARQLAQKLQVLSVEVSHSERRNVRHWMQ